MDIVKAGWLQRRTTILKNWKSEWFILTSDARLRRMSSPVKQQVMLVITTRLTLDWIRSNHHLLLLAGFHFENSR